MVSYKITKIKAREILDSRGNPTVEAEVYTKSGMAYGHVPSGASTGIHEALELRDGGKRYEGKGVQKAVKNVNLKISKKLKGMDVRYPKKIDQEMIDLDGTVNKSKLGANAILSVSLACASLLAQLEKKPLYSVLGKGRMLPIPFMNVINGGRHAENKLAIQEFMIAPFGKNFKESLRIGDEADHELKRVLAKKYGKASTNVGDEGGFAPNVNNVEEVLHLLMKTFENLGYEKKIKIGMDAAASEFFKQGYYHVDGRKMGYHRLLDFYEHMIKHFPIISIEDPFAQDHFLPWKDMTERLGSGSVNKKLQIVGDDLLCTNPRRIGMAVDRNMCNALLLKVNQIGTLSEAIDAAKLAMKNKWNVMVSHRSGETADPFIADLAVALNCGQIKTGAPCRSERLAKYNQLLRIEEQMGKRAKYAGKVLKFRK